MKEPHPRSWLIRYVIGVFSLLLCSVLTKFSVEGKKNLPPSGPYILAPNHIDDVDPAPITAAVVKPITFGMPILIPNEKRLKFEIVSILIVSIFWRF